MRHKFFRVGKIITASALTAAIVFSSCARSRSHESVPDAAITDVNATQNPIQHGHEAKVNVGFSFASKPIFHGEQNVEVVAQLPSSVRYRTGTADLKRPADDREITPQEVLCTDGSSYLIFDLSPVELVDTKNLKGKSDGEIQFTVDGVSPDGPVLVSAAASQDILPATCGAPFPAQLSTVIGVQ